MHVPGYRNAPAPAWHRDAAVDLAEAEEFVRRVHAEHPDLGSPDARLAAVRAQVAATGTYCHTSVELAFGAKLAWRNASRCIGRLYWRSLVVRDRRYVTRAESIFDELVQHLHTAGSPARRAIRPVLTVFAPARPGVPFARVWNEQLIRYAGYRAEDGSVVGDPRYVQFTEAVTERGWRGKHSPFDVLPIVVQTPDEGVRVFELPESAVWEVPLAHPDLPWFAELELTWHAVPAISNMRLSIGGVEYPLAPFNGWYMGTEIGARNLADADRYDLLPVVARRMGLDTSSDRTLWKDRALVELNRAVLWSFDRAGARISDHHTESHRFLEHVRKEERAGRPTPADWTWIVPPMSSAATPVFHRYYTELDLRPNFYPDEEAALLARTGRPELLRDPGIPPTLRLPTQSRRSNVPAPVPSPRLPLRPACPVENFHRRR
ncbi:nitric oxide synthase oxygenase [Virgisporangium aliadipatigenens]|uniref:Nitric oxide synthase oxygenase n=1 Tax=Virgisporangium aliadipatigenens TaxID=741659 RepID=A0A8J3YRW6_9ACTN|nr:nitric oxide synthase oxygenase [Virgisporangium aliadipatigenens]GIJ50734.1 nitric oxide synthase oxygenase [Virgisporangium aliadipatigenens]